jgi:CRISPR-associated protein Cas1
MTSLYLTEPGTVVRCQNQVLLIQKAAQSRQLRLAEIQLVVILPGVQLSSGAIAKLLDQGIETLFLTGNGQFRGRLQGQFPTNPALRLAQYRTVETSFGMALTQQLIRGKIRNQRTLLQRRNRETSSRFSDLSEAIDTIAAYLLRLPGQETPLDRDALMGLEGICARTYYQALRHWFEPRWQFTGRNRQPPLDPINALLSWGYGVLLARMFAACVQAGLDPYLGFFHAVEPYRPNLLLDLMEEFRPVIVDQAVIAIARSDLLGLEDFEPSPDGTGIWLGEVGKKLFLAELEKQFRKELLYPPQNRRLSVSQILVEQACWIGRCLVDRVLDYQPFLLK